MVNNKKENNRLRNSYPANGVFCSSTRHPLLVTRQFTTNVMTRSIICHELKSSFARYGSPVIQPVTTRRRRHRRTKKSTYRELFSENVHVRRITRRFLNFSGSDRSTLPTRTLRVRSPSMPRLLREKTLWSSNRQQDHYRGRCSCFRDVDDRRAALGGKGIACLHVLYLATPFRFV